MDRQEKIRKAQEILSGEVDVLLMDLAAEREASHGERLGWMLELNILLAKLMPERRYPLPSASLERRSHA